MDLRRLLSNNGIDCSTLRHFLGKRQTECWQLASTGQECLALWRRLRELVEHTKHWPVILGSDDSLRLMDEMTSRIKDWTVFRSEVLVEAGKLDGGQWFRDQRNPRKRAHEYRKQAAALTGRPGCESIVELYRGFAEDWERLSAQGPAAEPPPPWPGEAVPPRTSYSGPFDPYHPDQYLPKLWLGLAPTASFWEVPAYIPFGGFNACPYPPVHVAVLRHWQQSHQIELVTLTHDTIEVAVGRRPEKREEAIALARDQATYAEFEQLRPLNQPGHLAAHLLGSTVWQFWWD